MKPSHIRAVALLSTLLTPAAAFANNQCAILPDGQPVPSQNAVQAPPTPPAPALKPIHVLPPGPAPTPIHVPDVHAVSPVQPAQPHAPEQAAADRIKVASVHEMTAEEIAKIPGLAPVVHAGARIFVIGTAAGVPNILAVNGDHFQAFTPLSDPHYLCRGMIQDDKGTDITLEQAKKIPGLVRPSGAPAIAEIKTPDQAMEAVSKAAYGTYGPATAPKVWAIVDPLCVHSQQAIRDLLPYAKSGQIQLNIVPVPVISPQSAPAARVLLSGSQTDMLQRWLPGEFDKEVQKPSLLQAQYTVESGNKLMQNLRLFAGMSTGMGVAGVPEIIWTSAGKAYAKAGLDTAEVPSFIAGMKR